VNKAANEMDKVTQQNAANAEESASASEELSSQAETMQGFVVDLANLAGTSNGRGSAAPRGRLGLAGRGARRAEPVGTRALPAPAARQRGKSGSSAVMSAAEKAIPLDDDFQNF
jgi:methyl-accepting chemotaxis protein